MEKIELTDKISNILNKYKWDYKSVDIKILSKDEKMVYYNISIKYDDDKIETKKYKKHLTSYNRKVKINPNSLNNLKYKKKLNNDNIINVKQNILNMDDNNNFQDNKILMEGSVINNCITNKKYDKHNIKENVNIDNDNNFDFKKKDLNIESKIIESDKNVLLDKNYKNDNEFIDIDDIFNKEIDDTNCDNCEMMDNNILYLSKNMINVYLDIIKKYDNVIDTTYNINMNLEDLINNQILKDKKTRMDIYNIIQNKKKLNIDDINSINNILNESSYKMPHISALFRNKIIDPIIEDLRYFKNEYNSFIQLMI